MLPLKAGVLIAAVGPNSCASLPGPTWGSGQLQTENAVYPRMLGGSRF